MDNIKKFLDATGVSILWSKILEKFSAQKKIIDDIQETTNSNQGELNTLKGKVDALEAGTYDDSEVRNLISGNTTAINTNTAAITTLNGNAETVGSVAHTATQIAAAKIAEIVANANADFDTLKEIADWILNDTTGAADMANDIAALEAKMVGIEDTVVAKIATEIEAALKIDGADKYALASDLSSLTGRVKALEDSGYQNAEQVGSAIDAKIAALNLATTYEAKGAAATAETNAKAHADGLNSAMDIRVQALEGIDHTKFETAGAAAQALSDAKSYTDTEMAKIRALTEAEIDAIINTNSQTS